jgi:hypothetical protein
MLLVLFAAAILAGCGQSADPEVTFYADGTAMRLGPVQYCDMASEHCAADPQAIGTLRIRPGFPLQISVPGELANSAWAVTFTYFNAAGEQQEPLRSPLFTKINPQYAYTLALPNQDDRLDRVEVQQYGVRIQPSTTSSFDFVARGTWLLSVTDHD